MANQGHTQDLSASQVTGQAIPAIMITSPSPSNSVREPSSRISSTRPVLHSFEDWRPSSANSQVMASSANTGLPVDHARPQKRDSALGTKLCASSSQTSGPESDAPYPSVGGWESQSSPCLHKGNRKLPRWWRKGKAMLDQENQHGNYASLDDISIETGSSRTWLQVGAVRSGNTVPLGIRQFDNTVSRSQFLAETWSESIDLDSLESYEEVYRAVIRKAILMAFTTAVLNSEDIAGALFLKVWRGEHHITPTNWEELRGWCKTPGAKFKFEFSILPWRVRQWKRMKRMMDPVLYRTGLLKDMGAGVRRAGNAIVEGLKTLVLCGTTTEMDERDRIAVWDYPWPVAGDLGR